MAESTANYKRKGEMLGISGRIATRNYENKEGNKVYVTEIIAEEVTFIGIKKDSTNNTSESDCPDGVTPVDDNDDIPF